ncbi:DUF6355 family natural product biosynthesis protein [Actinokineospora sp.]|uniref:DUF6355 family natural product biosynthesis protein n=1 Tax=Actinokineospora sp. TaxID=1872133 RepID=UPI003D6B1D65
MRSLVSLRPLASLAIALSFAGLAAAPAAAVVEQNSPRVAASPLACGWDPDGPSGRAYYNHCGGGSWVWIRVERHHGLSGYDECVGPGRTYLGDAGIIKFAWYKGETC